MYNFNKKINRRGTDCYKWAISQEDDTIPMWVADMDFPTAPCITNALKKRVEHPIFGYTLVPDSYYEAITTWFENRHKWHINKDWIIYTSGVVPAMSVVIKALTEPGDKVIVQTPVYNCFFSSIRNQGCEISENTLKITETASNQPSYSIDFDDLEKKANDPKAKIFMLCNPHNPTGRVWTKEELKHIGEICRRHNIIVVSDEIHCELIMPDYEFTPFAAVSKENQECSITLNSPSKAFNIAGLQIANIITSNNTWYRKIKHQVNVFEVCDVNPFGVIALQEAYNNGGEWLDELNKYIADNYKTLQEFVNKELSQIKLFHMEGTYLAWLNITATNMNSDDFTNMLLKKAKVMVNSGTMYGKLSGEGFIRLNLATPRSIMMEGLDRIAQLMYPSSTK
mgnify:CR=1 FL=1